MSSSSRLPKNAIPVTGSLTSADTVWGELPKVLLQELLRLTLGTTLESIEIWTHASSYLMSNVSLVLGNGQRISFELLETIDGSSYLLPLETHGSTTFQSLLQTAGIRTEPSSSESTSSTADGASSQRSSGTSE